MERKSELWQAGQDNTCPGLDEKDTEDFEADQQCLTITE